MPRANQPMKAIKEMMEDVFTVQNLQDLIETNKKKKWKKGNEPEEPEDTQMPPEQIAMMMPYLEKMKNSGVDTNKIDPMWLMLLTGNQGKGNSNLNQLFLMMMMINAMSQSQPQQQNINGKVAPIQSGISPEMFQLLINEMQKIMNQQQQSPAIDPTLVTLLTILNKNQQNPKTDESTRLLLQELRSMQQQNQSQQLNLIVQNMNDRFEKALDTIAGSLNREPETTKMERYWNMLKTVQGDQREKSTAELEYGLKQQELLMKQQEHRDMLATEERALAREDAKGEKTMDFVTTAFDKIMGQGLGSLIGDIASNVGKKSKKASNEPASEFDSSLLDVL